MLLLIQTQSVWFICNDPVGLLIKLFPTFSSVSEGLPVTEVILSPNEF